MKLPMDPSVYMCYVMYSKCNFKEIACKWNKEFKTYNDEYSFTTVGKEIKRFRKKYWNTPQARGWCCLFHCHYYLGPDASWL